MTYRLRNIGLAIALAAVAVLLVFYYVAQERGRLQEDQELVPVWVAKKNIPAGTSGAELESGGYIEEKEVERSALSSSALLDPQNVAGKVVVNSIYRGEQVNVLRFRSQAQRGFRAQLTGNLRAVQLPGSPHQLLAGTLQAGDRVDVVGSWSVPEGSQHSVSRVILRDILVLEGAHLADATSAITQGPANRALSAKLAVTDAQEQKLFWMTEHGAWTLVLRPPTDSADSPEGAENWETIFADGLKAEQIQRLYDSIERKFDER
ncbi:MAG: Flp pilus assembly protein CpaB [Gaiellaceae bacterium]